MRRRARTRGLALRGQPAPLPEPLNRLDFDAYRDIRFRHRTGPPGVRRRAVPDAPLPPRLPLPAAGHRERDPRGRADAGALPEGPVRLRAATRSSGRCRSISASPGFRLHYPLNTPKIFDELIAFLGASYFRFLEPGPELRPLGAGPRAQRRGRGRRAGGVPVLPRVLDRDAGAGCRACRHLRASRQPLGDRGLPVRDLARSRRPPST